MIELKNITKVYGKKDAAFVALDDISLSISRGATVAIVGKSGSGKSTLMHIMSGLDRASDGHVYINKVNLLTMKPRAVDRFRARDIGFIFQSFFIEANQTCFDNVALPLEIKGVARSKRRALVEQALKEVDLLEKIDAKAGNLSGGQKQRLSIARAIVNKPKIIFADEPTGNLDSVNGEKIIKLLFDLNRRMGSILCVVTHDTELAARCKMQVVLKDGRVVNTGKIKKSGGIA